MWSRDPAQPIVQILAKAALLNQAIQILVRGRDDPHVAGDGFVAADTLEPPFLEQPQDLGLRGGSHVPDLVQEQRARVTLLELADPFSVGPRETAAFVPEQFALQQRFGNGGAIDGEEGGLVATAMVVDRPRHQLLAGAAFSEDQHVDVLGCHATDLLADRLHFGAAADQAVRLVFGPVADVHECRDVHQAADLERLPYDLFQLRCIQRFQQILIRPQFHGLDGRFGGPVAGDEDDHHLGVDPAQFVEQFQAGSGAQGDVQQHDLRGLVGGDLQPFLGRRGPQHMNVRAVEHLLRC